MQSKYYQKEEVIPICNHSNCHYSYFNEKYKSKLRKEFRQLTVQKRQMLFETTTQRILLYLDRYNDGNDGDDGDDDQSGSCNIQYPFSIHCFLPWNGSLISVCKQFYCHTLKISYNMLESHHHIIWKASQKNNINNNNNINSNIDQIYQCYYLPQIIQSFNIIPIDASSYSQNDINFIQNDIDLNNLYQPNPDRKLSDLAIDSDHDHKYPKLKINRHKNYNLHPTKKRIYRNKTRIESARTNTNEYRRRQFEKYMKQKAENKSKDKKSKIKKKKKKKNNNKEDDDDDNDDDDNDDEEPKLLLGFLRFQNNDNDEKKKKVEEKMETKKKENEDEMAPLNRFFKNISCITSRVETIASDYHQDTIREYEALRDHLYVQKIMSEADVVPGDQTVNEPKHWNKVERMFKVMDKKDSTHNRSKQHIDHAINNMHHIDFIQLLKEVKSSINSLISPKLKRSRASLLIDNKEFVLQSLQETMSGISNLHDQLISVKAILHTPDNIKDRKENRRQSLLNIGIDDEETLNAKPPQKFVEDVLLQKIDQLQQESDEWQRKYRTLTSKHRRLSLEQTEIVRALKNNDAFNKNERLSSITLQNITKSIEIGVQTDIITNQGT